MEKFPSFHNNVLPTLQKACIYGIPVGLAIYWTLKPKNLKKLRDNMGIILAYFAGVIAAKQDFKEREKVEEPLLFV